MDMETEVKLYYYFKQAHDDGYMSDATWLEYCEAVLEALMEENKEVLDRLKNM